MASSPLIRSPPGSPQRSSSTPAFLTPLNIGQQRKSPRSIGSATRMEQSPLKVAASLIQSLDVAHTEMISFAADAAADAERARRNARTAHEIARRYQNRSYPSFKLGKLEPSASSSVASTAATPSSIASRPKRPEARRFHNLTPTRKNTVNRLKHQDGEEKDYRIDDDDAENASLATSVVSKSSGMKGKPSSSVKTLSAPQSPTPYQRNKNRLAPQSPTSYERIAKHHADDLLQLSLELEQIKQELKSEQRLHKECQSSLELMKAKKIRADKQNQKIIQKYETERNETTAQISNLERELEVSRSRLEAAEEDAQLALDLAKDSAEQREKVEESLREARNEIEFLKNQQNGKPQSPTLTTPKRSVHFADTDVTDADATVTPITTPALRKEKAASPLFYTPRENGPPRAMIAAGRQLLLRRNMTPQDAVIRLEVSPAKSAERRQQLCRRLNKHLNESNSEETSMMLHSASPSQTPLSPTPGNALSINSTITRKKLEESNTAMQILQTSGKRLELDGHWWREKSNKTIPPTNDPIQIDIITRQYCQNVEFKINRQQKDINQLESLCGYLEKKLFLDEEPASNHL